MELNRHNSPKHAFTLVELLVVIAIIGILAALLLPAIQKSVIKARQSWCGSNLRQVGIGFHSFAHDHGGVFPQGVNLAQGGVGELAVSAAPRLGDLWLRPDVFRVLSNELGSVRVAFCPAAGQSATSFASIRPIHTTYFVGLRSSPEQPMSLLAGDNNFDTSTQGRTNVGGIVSFSWTPERHDRRGNLLFADGHVEGRRNVPILARPGGGKPTPTSFTSANTRGPGVSLPTGSASVAATPLSSPATAPAIISGISGNSRSTSSTAVVQAVATTAASAAGGQIAAIVSLPPKTATNFSELERTSRRLPHEDIVEQSFWRLYLIALLLGILAVMGHLWRRKRDQQRQPIEQE